MNAVFLFLTLGWMGCDATPRQVVSANGDVRVAVDATNAFTWDIYARLAEQNDGDDNLFLSPFSIHMALSMVLAGAEGATETEMRDVLHVTDEAAHHDGLGALTRDLSGARQRPYTLHVANRIWAQDDIAWKEPFLALNRDTYGVAVGMRDITGSPEATRNEVNDWVSDQTQGRVSELFEFGQIHSDTWMVLANAIYFLADWKHGFDASATASAPFTTPDGHVIQVPTMYQNAPARIGDGTGFRVLGLPYESEELAFWVVLPDVGTSLPALESALDVTVLASALDGAVQVGEVAVALPKLEARTRIDLKQTLSAMGMSSAFLPQADLSAMTSQKPISLGAAVHEAFVRIDEKGTEAAAATGVTVVERSAGEAVSSFVVDRPHLFAIRDELTGALLFVGRVTNPSRAAADPES